MLTRKSRILSIIPKRNKKNIHTVTISNGSSFEVSKEIIQSKSLFEGLELDESDFEKIFVSENYFRVKEAGMRLLSYRMRSKKELNQKLIKKGFSIEVINDVMLEDIWLDVHFYFNKKHMVCEKLSTIFFVDS